MTLEIVPEMDAPKPAILKRADALDALRGIAILAMILSGTIPFDGSLPAWMYHAQVPPPDYKFNPNLPGLTWVDLVFPLFLFALGAAIPLAYSRRLERGQTRGEILGAILKRGFFLAAFAIISQHFRPVAISSEPGDYKWRFGLLGFAILFLMFVRWPRSLPQGVRIGAPTIGWAAAIIFLVNIRYPVESKSPYFTLERSDIILLILANIAVFTALIWLFTRHNWIARLGILIFLFPLFLSFGNDGWNTQFLKLPEIKWLFNFDYLKYLFIAIPGTIVGDWLEDWLQRPREEGATWRRERWALLLGVAIALQFVLLVGLQSRWLVGTAILSAFCCALGYLCVRNPRSDTEKLIQKLYLWACYGLSLGLAFEPYEGGIKKDSATMSYFFVTAAMSVFLLIALLIAIAIFKQRRGLQIFIDNGQNPLLAYVAFGNFLWPILELSGLQKPIVEAMNTPWLGFLKGFIYTSIIALLVSLCTRLKLFWKT